MKLILKKPLLTEKQNMLQDKYSQYSFVVDKTASKEDIKAAVEKMFSVEVERVNTMRYAGKAKSRYTRTGMVKGRQASFKKAVVTLKEGHSIDIYANI